MSRVCVICAHPERAAIDTAVVSGEAEHSVAGRFSVAKTSLQRHRPHTAARLARVEAGRSRSLATILEKAHGIIEEVIRGADDKPALKLQALDRLAKFAELEFGSKSKVTTVADPMAEWMALPPTERRERLVEMKHRLLELENEQAAEGRH